MNKQQENRPVAGSDLRARWETATNKARSAQQQAPVWIGYPFNVRHGVAVEIVPEAGVENRNLGFFFQYDPRTDSIKKFEVRNLDRADLEVGGFWLGKTDNDQSVSLLEDLIRNKAGDPITPQLVEAIAMHEGARADAALEAMAQSATGTEKKMAAYWLRERATAKQPFKDLPADVTALTAIVRNEQESLSVRSRAAAALGTTADPEGLRALASLYQTAKDSEVKKLILNAAVNKVNETSVALFLDVAASERDERLRQQAFSWLAEKTGNRIVWNVEPGLRLFANDQISDSEQSKLNAITHKAPAEAVAELIKIAESDAKIGVRKAAVMQLGRLGDQRALPFFRKVLTAELKGRPASAA